MDPNEEGFVRYVVGRDEGVFDEWGEVTARVWYRAKAKCEYCDDCLLENRDAYSIGQIDHILPKCTYARTADEAIKGNPNVLALACAICNHIKGSRVLKDLKPNIEDLLICGEARNELIRRYRTEVIERAKHQRKQQMDRFLDAVRRSFPELECRT